MKLTMFANFLLPLMMFAGQFNVEAKVLERVGYAYDLSTGELIYTEQHKEKLSNNKVQTSTVFYRDNAGKLFAKKQLDFRKNTTSPLFELINSANGHQEGVRYVNSIRQIFFRKTIKDELEVAELTVPKDAIIDGGFDRFIEENWKALMAGEKFVRPFLVPSFQRFVDFKIYMKQLDKQGDPVFVLETNSFLLRVLSSKVLVTYNKTDGTLRRYEGISNIRNQKGDNYKVRVEFLEADRKLSEH